MSQAKDITTSLEVSQELDKRGVRLGSYFIHNLVHPRGKSEPEWIIQSCVSYFAIRSCEAPTAGELLAVLPYLINENQLHIRKYGDELEVAYPKSAGFLDVNLANSCGRMLLWLLDNNHITVEQVNESPTEAS